MPQFHTFLAALCLALALPALAQDAYPARPVRIINTLPAGSSTDIRARIIAEGFTRLRGQQVFVENRPGGGGIVSVQATLSAPADGYTLLAAPGSIFSLLPAQKDALPFDVTRDLVPIGLTSVEPMLIAVAPRLGITTLAELLALGHKDPHKIVIGTNASGSIPHLAGRLLLARSNVPITLLPYSSGGTVESVRDIMGGRIHAVIEARPGIVGSLDGGELKAVAVMSGERLSSMPGLPLAEDTIAGLRAVGWAGLVTAKGTPDAIIRRLTSDLRSVLEDPDVRKRIDQIGTPFKPLFGADFARFIDDEQKRWWPLVRQFSTQP